MLNEIFRTVALVVDLPSQNIIEVIQKFERRKKSKLLIIYTEFAFAKTKCIFLSSVHIIDILHILSYYLKRDLQCESFRIEQA